jgi:arsenical pump membrane protein
VRETATFVVLAATISLIVVRPRWLNEGIIASAGALAVIALGTATFADVRRGFVDTVGILGFLIAMMVVATVAEYAGVFEWAAGEAARLSRGRGRLLFVNLYLLGALVTLFLSLDVTAIMVAPVVVALVQRARLSPWPFILSVAFVANTASLFLPVSNLTNMLVYGLLHIPFWDFVRLMFLPNLAAMAVNVAVFLVVFRDEIPGRFSLPIEVGTGTRAKGFRVALVGLGLVVIGLVGFGMLGLPLYLPAVVGAIVLAPLAVARDGVPVRALLAGIAWPLPLFVVGMYTIVAAAGRLGLNDLWHAVLTGAGPAPSLLNLWTLTFATALGSNLVNNLPMALVAIAGLESARPIAPVSAFAALIGTNIGPNVTIFGSLATMLVVRAAGRRRVAIGGWSYLAIGLITTPPMLLVAGTVLWALAR